MTREMKDSGIETIGKIPTNWKCLRVSRIATVVRGASPRPAGDPRLFNGDYIPWITVAEVTNVLGNYIESTETFLTKEGSECSRIVEAETLLLSNSGATLGVPKITKIRGCINDGSVAFYDLKVNQKYLLYVFASYTDELRKRQQGYGQPNLNTDLIKELYIPVPPLDEQRRIASFLDRQCAELDAVMEKTRAIIEECKKLKQAVISQAVTRGVRGARPMKDSGIEWIGEIPVEWETCELKKIANFNQDKYSSDDGDLDYIGLENIESWNGRFIKIKSAYERDQALICEKGDIIFGKLRPYLAKVYLLPKRQCCSTEFIVVRMNGRFVVKYYWYLLISQLFVFWVDSSTYGSRMPRANVNFIKNTSITIPSFDEQAEIVEYLDRQCGEIDALIAKEEQRLAELETCKKSLIYETVTGKREVE